MTNKELILRSIDFIEANLKEEINVMEIAQKGCYSLYHFIRLFQSVTGIPPNRYLLQRRLSEAAVALRDSDKRISDIASEYRFGSHEAFSRAFRKNFGTNPSQVRNGYSLTAMQLTNRINAEYLYESDKARNQPPELVELEERILAGISFFIRDDEEISDLGLQWGQFMNHVAFIKNRIVPERYYQVQFWSEQYDLGGLYFYIGTEVSSLAGIDPQFVVKVIPEGRYLRFIHKGLANKVGYTYRYIYNKYLPETDYKLSKPFNFEFYGEKCTGPHDENSESEIFIPVE